MSGQQITQPFNEPYSQALAALPSTAGGNLVGIDGRAYLIDNESGRYGQRAIDVLQQRNVSDQRDIVLLPQNIWRQSVSSWHSGSGQTNLDRDDAIPSRYEDSYGIDPWDRWEIKLLNETEKFRNAQTTNRNIFLQVHNDELVVIENNVLYWFDGIGSNVSASASVTTGTVPIIDTTYDGNEVVVLNSSGEVFKCPNNTTSTLYVTEVGATFVAFTKDYLICGTNNTLRNITGTPTTIYTHPMSTFRWVAACSGPRAIYAIGSAGDRTTIHRVGIKDDGTGLDPAIVAAELPDGEIGFSIDSYLGYILIGTNKGVRVAVADANGDLTLGAIIPSDAPVYDFEGQDRFIWYTKSSIDVGYAPVNNDDSNVFPQGTVCGLGRLDLSTFTVTSLTPAAANDLVAEDQSGKTVRSVVTYRGIRVFSVNNGGVYFETANKMPGGWFVQGVITFSVEDLKSALYGQLMWNPGCAGRLNFDLAYDSTGFARFGQINISPLKIRSENIQLYGAQFSRVNVRIVMRRCPFDNANGPRLTRIELRSTPVKGRASRWEVPVIIADEIEINGAKEVCNVVEEKNRLLDLVQTGKVFLYQESGQSYQVLARDFVWQAESLSMAGNGWQGTFLLVMEEVT
jgi:hypothetical protein